MRTLVIIYILGDCRNSGYKKMKKSKTVGSINAKDINFKLSLFADDTKTS